MALSFTEVRLEGAEFAFAWLHAHFRDEHDFPERTEAGALVFATAAGAIRMRLDGERIVFELQAGDASDMALLELFVAGHLRRHANARVSWTRAAPPGERGFWFERPERSICAGL